MSRKLYELSLEDKKQIKLDMVEHEELAGNAEGVARLHDTTEKVVLMIFGSEMK